jgi:hypothetical protein
MELRHVIEVILGAYRSPSGNRAKEPHAPRGSG